MCVLLVTHDTFQVQIAGSIGVLGDGVGVDFQCVHVVRVTGNHHVVPLVVIQLLVGVAFHQRGSIAQVENVVDIPARATKVNTYLQTGQCVLEKLWLRPSNCVLIGRGPFRGMA